MILHLLRSRTARTLNKFAILRLEFSILTSIEGVGALGSLLTDKQAAFLAALKNSLADLKRLGDTLTKCDKLCIFDPIAGRIGYEW